MPSGCPVLIDIISVSQMVYPRQYPVQNSPQSSLSATVNHSHNSTSYLDLPDTCLEWSIQKQTYSCFGMWETCDSWWDLFEVYLQSYWVVLRGPANIPWSKNEIYKIINKIFRSEICGKRKFCFHSKTLYLTLMKHLKDECS